MTEGFHQLRSFLELGLDALPTPERLLLRIIGQWDRIVGPEMARQVRPAAVTRRILHVKTHHEHWVRDVKRFQPRILAELRRATDVEWERLEAHLIPPPARRAAPAPSTQPPREEPQGLSHEWREVLSRCSDHDLRLALKRMMTAYLGSPIHRSK